MTRDDIIAMAREAGAYCHHGDFNMGHSYELQPDQLERFAALVAAAEREAITKAPTYRMLAAISEQFDSDHAMGIGFDPQTLCQAVLKAIRARGETK